MAMPTVILSLPRRVGQCLFPSGRLSVGYASEERSFFTTYSPLLKPLDPPVTISLGAILPNLENDGDDESPYNQIKFFPHPDLNSMLVVVGARPYWCKWTSLRIYIYRFGDAEAKCVVELQPPAGNILVPDQSLEDQFVIYLKQEGQIPSRKRSYNLSSWEFKDEEELVHDCSNRVYYHDWMGEPSLLGDQVYLTDWASDKRMKLYTAVYRHGTPHCIEPTMKEGQNQKFGCENQIKLIGDTFYAITREMESDRGVRKLMLWRMDPTTFAWEYENSFKITSNMYASQFGDFAIMAERDILCLAYIDDTCDAKAMLFYLPMSISTGSTEKLIHDCPTDRLQMKQKIDPHFLPTAGINLD